MKIGNYIIIKTSEMPLYEKAHKLARVLSEDDLDDILAGRRHLRRNPIRKTVVVTFPDGVHPYDAAVNAVNAVKGFPDIKNSREEDV